MSVEKGGYMIENKENENRRRVMPIISLLVTVLAITSCFMWYLIKEHSVKEVGNIVINLDPYKNRIPLSLYAVVVDESGNAVADHEVELENESKEVITTKSAGDLFFFDISNGKQTMILYGKNNEILASVTVNIVFSNDVSKYQYDKETNTFTVSKDVALLELKLVLDGDKLIIQEPISVVTNNSKWLYGDDVIYSMNSTIVSALNNVILQEGSIVIPNFGIILNDGRYLAGEGILYSNGTRINLLDFDVSKTTIQKISDTHFILENGAIVKFIDGSMHVYTTDGSETIFFKHVILKDGTIIKPNGEIIDSNGNTHQNSNGLVVGDGFVKPATDIEDETNDVKQWYDLLVYDDEVRWTSATKIDLFGSVDGVIAPGDYGSYSFVVENNSDFDVEYTLALQEQALLNNGGKLPLLYRVRQGINYLGSDEYVDADTIKDIVVLLPKNSSRQYVLEWQWPFEGNDEYDTSLAMADNLTHMIQITIHAKSR